MSVKEIEQAIRRLDDSELAEFRAWFLEFDANAWDQQIESDMNSGRLDSLAQAALQDLRAGRCTDL
jgi:hypothetical protein